MLIKGQNDNDSLEQRRVDIDKSGSPQKSAIFGFTQNCWTARQGHININLYR